VVATPIFGGEVSNSKEKLYFSFSKMAVNFLSVDNVIVSFILVEKIFPSSSCQCTKKKQKLGCASIANRGSHSASISVLFVEPTSIG